MQDIKLFFARKISTYSLAVRTEYGRGKAISAALVFLKLLLFYTLMGVQSYFAAVWLVSCFFAFLLFSAFRNKWIPAAAYLIFSVLMFADVTYSSFFNRYLSVNMLGAAGVLGDIGASILEVLRPEFFLMPADALAILAMLAVYTVRRLRREQQGIEEVIIVEVGQEDVPEDPAEDGLPANPDGSGPGAPRAREKKKCSIPHAAALIVLVALILWNPAGSRFVMSLSHQEALSFHLGDVISDAFGGSAAAGDFMGLLAGDSYAAEKNGPLFGVAEGRNLIVIQVESLQNFVIGLTYNGQEITPNLNRLIQGNSIYFDNFFHQVGGGNTSDAEFAVNNSVCGTLKSYTYQLFPENTYRGLPVLLKEKGYSAAVFHAHEDRDFWNREQMYKAQGFDRFYGGLTDRGGDYERTEWMGWGLSDTEFLDQTLPFMQELEEPFYSFIVTLSNHHPYLMPDHYNFIDLLPGDEGSLVGQYLQSAAYTDYALGLFFAALKEAGLYENSLIAVYGDHQGLPMESTAGASMRLPLENAVGASMRRLLGKPYDFDTMMNVPLIFALPDGPVIGRQVHTAGGQIDFLPTAAYLMGFETLDTVYLGHNLLTVEEGFVATQTYMLKGSFILEETIYEMSRDGVFENGRAWNRKTGETVPLADCWPYHLRALDVVDASDYFLYNDILDGYSAEGGAWPPAAGR
jgi:phosphoglycerol transferase MdoB-like AlkP superfamily enzyme